jgi:hypothetical protein
LCAERPSTLGRIDLDAIQEAGLRWNDFSCRSVIFPSGRLQGAQRPRGAPEPTSSPGLFLFCGARGSRGEIQTQAMPADRDGTIALTFRLTLMVTHCGLRASWFEPANVALLCPARTRGLSFWRDTSRKDGHWLEIMRPCVNHITHVLRKSSYLAIGGSKCASTSVLQ